MRIAQAQLVGWLEGLFHGIQTALFAQQMAARAQLEQMRRRAIGRPAASRHWGPRGRPTAARPRPPADLPQATATALAPPVMASACLTLARRDRPRRRPRLPGRPGCGPRLGRRLPGRRLASVAPRSAGSRSCGPNRSGSASGSVRHRAPLKRPDATDDDRAALQPTSIARWPRRHTGRSGQAGRSWSRPASSCNRSRAPELDNVVDPAAPVGERGGLHACSPRSALRATSGPRASSRATTWNSAPDSRGDRRRTGAKVSGVAASST